MIKGGKESVEQEAAQDGDWQEARARFQKFLSKAGFRVTNQRLAIFDAAMAITEHFRAEDLLERARGIDPSVSRATVYRTLPILIESQAVREIDVGRDFKYYLANHGKQTEKAQVVCLDCDKIFEIDAPFMEWYGSSVTEKMGLRPESQRLQVNARCHRCDKDGNPCENKKS